MTLNKKIEIIERDLIVDERGYFLKIINGKESELPNYTGEIYVTNAIPGESRGGHYHLEAIEWFTIIEGEAFLLLEDIKTKESIELILDCKKPVTVKVPTNVAHLFKNNSNENFILLAYTNKLYCPSDTIPYSFN